MRYIPDEDCKVVYGEAREEKEFSERIACPCGAFVYFNINVEREPYESVVVKCTCCNRILVYHPKEEV